jgi:hypothetical protein
MVHQDGVMRLATARDEIEPLRSGEVRQNHAYLTVLLLARTVTRLGTLTDVTPAVGRPDRGGGRAIGEMTRPSPEQLFAETARLAHHFHWPLDTILDLEHPDRRRFLGEIDVLTREA